MIKRWIMVLFFLAAMLCVGTAAVNAGDFEIEKGVLVHYVGNGGSVTIPSGVAAIADYAFYECEKITEVTIPSEVKSIGAYAFSRCSGLKNVTMSKGVVSIGEHAFDSCWNLAAVTLPEGIKTIGKSAFYECSALTKVSIPKGATSIEESAFAFCSGLRSVKLPEGLTSIGDHAFCHCSGLAAVTIPESVKKIGYSAFSNCTSLTDLAISSKNLAIERCAFMNCISLASVTIPSGVSSIGAQVFDGCSNLAKVTIQPGVKSIGSWVFDECPALASISLPSGMEKIGSSAIPGSDYGNAPYWYSEKDGAWYTPDEIECRTGNGIADRYYAYDPMITPFTTAITLKNTAGTVITGKTITTGSKTYKIDGAAAPAKALQIFSWTSGNLNIAAVDKTGLVTFQKAGTVTITAKAVDDSSQSASVTLSYAPQITSVTIQDSSGRNITGKTVKVTSAKYQLKAAAYPEEASQKFTWKSSNTKIATVKAGKVTFKKAGKVTITATAKDGSGKSASVTLKTDIKATKLIIRNKAGKNISRKTIKVSTKTYKLKAAAAPTKFALQKFTWKSSNTKIATVKAGKVTFKKAGTVKISVKAKDGSGKTVWVKLSYKP